MSKIRWKVVVKFTDNEYEHFSQEIHNSLIKKFVRITTIRLIILQNKSDYVPMFSGIKKKSLVINIIKYSYHCSTIRS